ncbi:MAG: nagA [Naasia sp.]|jgi:N-acetylglucosamine-6-phosphate deacetylase|uniref:N-acetylglucosamine-6-phosphate deacetylase n=1 Tax=Naasia sp. TaxID=2546198 RepID=UPI00262564E1|nr:N-acetylglucosamine-6-phosphate deacetylase [Naasia sp.]MCU1571691.1 nagA [Naasia sp.]
MTAPPAVGGPSNAAGAVLVHGARLLDAHGFRDGWLLLRDGRIEAGGDGDPPEGHRGERIDATGGVLVPGLLDLHLHGGGGRSFDEAADAAAVAVLAAHRERGTTGTLASLVSAPIDELERSLLRFAALAEREQGILGVHLEGPFLSPSRAGAHALEALCEPTADRVDRLLSAGRGVLRSVTLAPELPGGLDAVQRFAEAGVLVGVGHTEADYDLTRAAFRRGARFLTHAMNAMPGLGHRAPGPVAAALDDREAVLELILDGEHVHPALARLLFAAAPGRIALVTDAMAGAAAGDGDYLLGGLEVTVRSGRATLAGTATLAGSTLTTSAALRGAIRAGIDPADAVAALTTVPGRLLGEGDRRLLRPGSDAGVVLLDGDWAVRRVWPVSGR